VSNAVRSSKRLGLSYNGNMTELLEEAITKVKQLSSSQQDAMAAVILAELEDADWDRQIEQDLKAGKLDSLIKRVRGDVAAGRSQPL
jgi:muramidase (phage lysozyme)